MTWYEIFPRILNMSLTASVIICLVLLCRLLLKKAPKIYSYILWSVVIFRLLCPVSFSAPVSVLGIFDTPVMEQISENMDDKASITSTVAYIPMDIVHTEYPEVESLEDRDKAKAVMEELGIHYTSGKTLVPFRLSGNVEWGVPYPECEDLRDLTFWVWPESLWAPISFTMAYLKEKCKGASMAESCISKGAEDNLSGVLDDEQKWCKEMSRWWDDDEAAIYQFIGEDNIYFYAIAQTGLFTGLRVPKGEKPDMEKMHHTHIVANRHLLYMDTKASSSSEIKPPMADELLNYYTKDQLRMHFMSLGLSSKSVGFKPQAFMKEEERVGVDMVLKEGNLITNVYNRLIRSCFYGVQNNCGGKIPEGEAVAEIKTLAENAVAEYERHMYNHDFHRISYVLDDFIRAVNKHWVNNVKIADANGDVELRKQLVVDCFFACKVMAVLLHPIVPEGCEMFREYLNLSEEMWSWEHILEPVSYYVDDLSCHELKFLEPRVDFFKKHECQMREE